VFADTAAAAAEQAIGSAKKLGKNKNLQKSKVRALLPVLTDRQTEASPLWTLNPELFLFDQAFLFKRTVSQIKFGGNYYEKVDLPGMRL
jgi:hypothetical protein